MTAELEDRQETWGGGLNGKYRPWVSLSGLLLMIVGGLIMFYPMCSVLEDFGKCLCVCLCALCATQCMGACACVHVYTYI
jgi:hypothetical protein